MKNNFHRNITCSTNRKQKFGKALTSLRVELERLSRLTYPECPFVMQDKIACTQFITALSDGFIKRALQLEGITSLKLTVERVKTVTIIRGESFEKKRGKIFRSSVRKEKKKF